MSASGRQISRSLTSVITASDDAILDAIGRYYFLTSEQVCRLLFSQGSLTYVRARLKLLAERRYCARLFLPRPSPYGSAPSVFSLSRKGLGYLQSCGRPVPDRFRPSES